MMTQMMMHYFQLLQNPEKTGTVKCFNSLNISSFRFDTYATTKSKFCTIYFSKS